MSAKKKAKRTAKVVPIKQKVVFKARPHSRITDKDARVIGKRLVELGGNPAVAIAGLADVSPRDFLDDARSPKSPTHKFFDWDKNRAAEKHWLTRAGQLMRSVAVEVRVTGGGVITRGWHNVRVEVGRDDEGVPQEARRYVPLDVIKKDPTLVEQILADAARELRGWANRYQEYACLSDVHAEAHRELLPVYRVIDELEAKIGERPTRRTAG